jgi:bacterioferritin-associated ferredoxin
VRTGEYEVLPVSQSLRRFASSSLRLFVSSFLSSSVDPDDHVCLCFRVSLRKIRTFLKTEDPPVASLISECLSAGTGCQWCVPFLKHLHAQHARGERPDLKISPQRYAQERLKYHASGARDEHTIREVAPESVDPPPTPPAPDRLPTTRP